MRDFTEIGDSVARQNQNQFNFYLINSNSHSKHPTNIELKNGGKSLHPKK